MITEDYVNFETAKLLKEKGFDEACHAYYYEDDGKLIESYSPHAIKNISNPCFFGNGAPTLQMARKWLMKKYNLEIYPYHDIKSKWWFEIVKYPNSVSEYESGMDEEFDTYEQAVEVAIKYCLENLI